MRPLAEQQFESDTIVRENLEAQQQQVSGVNSDIAQWRCLSGQHRWDWNSWPVDHSDHIRRRDGGIDRGQSG